METSKKDEISIKFNFDAAEQNGFFDEDEQYVMFILVNDELKMDMNKLIQFCCHSVCKVIIENERSTVKSEAYINWVNNYEPTIVLKAKGEDLIFCINEYSDVNKDIWCKNVIDLGKINVSPFSITTVAFTPMMKKDVPNIIKYLKEL